MLGNKPEHEKRDLRSFFVDCEISTFQFLERRTNVAKKKLVSESSCN